MRRYTLAVRMKGKFLADTQRKPFMAFHSNAVP